MPVFPDWWNEARAIQVERFIAANCAAFPANVALYNGTKDQEFFKKLTGFDGSAKSWVEKFFQFDLSSTAQCGPGIYGANNRDEAEDYGTYVMKAVDSTLRKARYIDISGNNLTRLPHHGLNPQDIRRYAYKCIVRFTPNYYAVKDPNVEWDPN